MSFILSVVQKKLRENTRNSSGFQSRMATPFTFLNLSNYTEQLKRATALAAPTPTSEDDRETRIQKQTLDILKGFDDLKMKFNDCLSFEAQTLREKDVETAESLKAIFAARSKKLFAFHQELESLMKARLSAQVA